MTARSRYNTTKIQPSPQQAPPLNKQNHPKVLYEVLLVL